MNIQRANAPPPAPQRGEQGEAPARIQDALLAGLVALLALAPRLPGLDIFLTADEPKAWFGRSIQFLEALARSDWAATFDSPAPGVTTMWAGAIGLLLEYARQGFPEGGITSFLAQIPFDPLSPTILPLIRLPGVLIAVLAVVLTYLWGRNFLGRAGAFLAAALLALDPFLLALSRILGHDALVALFMWLSLLAFLRAINRYQLPIRHSPSAISHSPFPIGNRRFIIISGALGGLAFLTKYPSLALGAFIALVMLILYLCSSQRWPQALRAWAIDLALWSMAAGLVFVVLWPVMWVQPLTTVGAILADALRASSSPHPKGSFFLGQPVPDPGATFYLLVTLFKTTPLLWLGWLLAVVGAIFTLTGTSPKGAGRSRPSGPVYWQVALILLAFALSYGLLVSLGGKKQDRYILPSFPALATLAALGYTFFFRIRRIHLSKLIWLLLVVIILQLVLVLPAYPYYFTYYNPLLGGGRAAARTMIVGWGEGLDAAARWLNEQPDADTAAVVSWYSTTFEPYFKGQAIYKVGEEKISRTPKPGLVADYLVLYVNQLQREIPSAGALQHFQAVEPLQVISLGGIDYAWIYPSVGMQYVIEAETRLVGQAELLGYNWRLREPQSKLREPQSNDVPAGGLLAETPASTSAPLTQLPADQRALVQLYWEWQGKAPDEPIGLSLVDEAGQTWGWGTRLGTQARLPFEAWQIGMVAYDEFALVVFPGTPPGDYYLKAWIDRPATNEVVGVFPLNATDARIAVTRPDAPPAVAELGLLERPRRGSEELNVSLTEKITLLGLNGLGEKGPAWQPGQSRELLLYWQARGQIREDWPAHLTLEDQTGLARAEWAGRPVGGRFPTSLWQTGDVVRDPWTLTLPPYVPPGDYRLVLRLEDGEGASLASVSLASVSVEGRPRSFAAPPLDLPLEAQFGSIIKLSGLQGPIAQSTLTVDPGQVLSLALIWQSTALTEADYTVTVQLLDGQNQVRAQQDSMPLNGAAPTTSWAIGEVVQDQISLSVPMEVGPGPHRLLIALYRPETGERLPLAGGSADHIAIPVALP